AAQPALKKEMVASFQRWKERFLLSPLPPESWTLREGLLYELFTIFPASLEGLNESSAYLERVLDQEDTRSAFKDWRQIFLKPPHEPDVNYRKWRKANDHFKYLVEHPELYTWLCAIAVCQQPTWELSIAIGKALQSKGVEVTFDNLSILARIPWLQNGDLHPRLRQDLIAQLDTETEQLARAAVEAELEAVKGLTKASHANRALNTELAIQKFSTAPENYDHQQTIHFLLENKLLSRQQIESLNFSINRHQGEKEPTSIKKKTKGNKGLKNQAKAQLQQFLEDRITPEEPPRKPFFTPHLKRAIQLGSCFTLLMILVLTFHNTVSLHDLVFGKRSAEYEQAHDQLKDYFFVKESPEYDDAKLFNEIGVDAIEKMEIQRGRQNINTWLSTKMGFEDQAKVNFVDALTIKPGYELARNNLVKAEYNFGVERYQAFLNDSVGVTTLQKATNYFHRSIEQSQNDSLTRDAWHALGLTHHYLQQKDSAQFYLDQIIVDNPRYFIELQQQPNLQTLLTGPVPSERVYQGLVFSSDNNRPIQNIQISSTEQGVQTTSNAQGSYALPLPYTADQPSNLLLTFRGPNIQEKRIRVNIIGPDSLETVFLRANANQANEDIEIFERNNLFGLRNKAGKVILPPAFVVIGAFSEGLAYVQDRQAKIGYVNRKGVFVIDSEYDPIEAQAGFDTNQSCPWNRYTLSNFYNGRALVRKGNYFGFINPSGDLVIPLEYDFATPFSYCQMQTFDVRKSENAINDYSTYWEGPPYDNEAFVVRNGNESLYIDLDGNCTRGKDCQTDANSFVDTRDGNRYKTVKIGNQIWMAENLNYGKLQPGKIMCHGDNSSNCQQYGKLYDWASAQTACPNGWHLPTRGEMETLFLSVVGSPDLKKIYAELIEGGASQFNLLLAGGYDPEDGFMPIKQVTALWTSTVGTRSNQNAFTAAFSDQTAELIETPQTTGMSCRCVKGAAPPSQNPNTSNPTSGQTAQLFPDDEFIKLYFDYQQPDVNQLGADYSSMYQLLLSQQGQFKSNHPEVVNAFVAEAKREYQQLKTALGNLLEELNKGATKRIKLYGHANRDLSSAEAKELSTLRVGTIAEEIRRFQSKALVPFLDSGQLIIEQLPQETRDTSGTGAVSELLNSSKVYAIEVIRKRRVDMIIENARNESQQSTPPQQNTGTSSYFVEMSLEAQGKNFGKMVFQLYDETPIHRDNFLRRTKEGFYDDLQIHEIIRNRWAEGGDPKSRRSNKSITDPGYPLQQEPGQFNYFGALVAVSSPNTPYNHGSLFRILLSPSITDAKLDLAEKTNRIVYSIIQRRRYKTNGGTPEEDGKSTVFGQLVEGREVLLQLIQYKVDSYDKPIPEIRTQIRVLENYRN
ncbi:MAG: FISUMP domain-containing protein, partial [Bacteroidota bacterium]